jgi:hypothetical protein
MENSGKYFKIVAKIVERKRERRDDTKKLRSRAWTGDMWRKP